MKIKYCSKKNLNSLLNFLKKNWTKKLYYLGTNLSLTGCIMIINLKDIILIAKKNNRINSCLGILKSNKSLLWLSIWFSDLKKEVRIRFAILSF